MRSTPFAAALIVLVAALSAAGTAGASSPPYVPPDQPIFIWNIGTGCPGFAPYFPDNVVAYGPGGGFNTGYFTWNAGEYLDFQAQSVIQRGNGRLLVASGSGVPPATADYAPTSDYTYRLMLRVTDAEGPDAVDGDVKITRSDGATVSGTVFVKTDGNHFILVTGFTSQPTCRQH